MRPKINRMMSVWSSLIALIAVVAISGLLASSNKPPNNKPYTPQSGGLGGKFDIPLSLPPPPPPPPPPTFHQPSPTRKKQLMPKLVKVDDSENDRSFHDPNTGSKHPILSSHHDNDQSDLDTLTRNQSAPKPEKPARRPEGITPPPTEPDRQPEGTTPAPKEPAPSSTEPSLQPEGTTPAPKKSALQPKEPARQPDRTDHEHEEAAPPFTRPALQPEATTSAPKEPAPSSEEPALQPKGPAPSFTRPALQPEATTPAPKEPAPSSEEPALQPKGPAPSFTRPALQPEAPTPAPEEPAPSSEEPALQPKGPAPSFTRPALSFTRPALQPEATTPAPKEPAPSSEEPALQPKGPAPSSEEPAPPSKKLPRQPEGTTSAPEEPTSSSKDPARRPEGTDHQPEETDHEHEEADHEHKEADQKHEEADHEHKEADHEHEEADHEHEEADHEHEEADHQAEKTSPPEGTTPAPTERTPELEESENPTSTRHPSRVHSVGIPANDSLPSLSDMINCIDYKMLGYTLFCIVTTSLVMAVRWMLCGPGSSGKDLPHILSQETSKVDDKREQLYDKKRELGLNKDSNLHDHLERLNDYNRELTEELNRQNRLAPIKRTLHRLRAQLGSDIDDRISSRKDYSKNLKVFCSILKQNNELKNKVRQTKYDKLMMIQNIVDLEDLSDILSCIEFNEESKALGETSFQLRCDEAVFKDQLDIMRNVCRQLDSEHCQLINEVSSYKKKDAELKSELLKLLDLCDPIKFQESIDTWEKKIKDKVEETDRYYKIYIENYYKCMGDMHYNEMQDGDGICDVGMLQ